MIYLTGCSINAKLTTCSPEEKHILNALRDALDPLRHVQADKKYIRALLKKVYSAVGQDRCDVHLF